MRSDGGNPARGVTTAAVRSCCMKSTLPFWVVASLAGALITNPGCGGKGAAGGADSAVKKALKRDLNALGPIMAKMGFPGVHARGVVRKAKDYAKKGVIPKVDPVEADGYDDSLGLWYSGLWDPYAYTYTLYSDEAMTIAVGTETYTSEDPTLSGGMVVWPDTTTYALNITTGPQKQSSTWSYTDQDGSGQNFQYTSDYVDAVGDDYALVYGDTSGVFSSTSTTTFVGGPTVTSTATATPENGQILTWSDSTGEEGFFNINSDNSGNGSIGTATATQATMTWDTDGIGTIVYADGTSEPFTLGGS